MYIIKLTVQICDDMFSIESITLSRQCW